MRIRHFSFSHRSPPVISSSSELLRFTYSRHVATLLRPSHLSLHLSPQLSAPLLPHTSHSHSLSRLISRTLQSGHAVALSRSELSHPQHCSSYLHVHSPQLPAHPTRHSSRFLFLRPTLTLFILLSPRSSHSHSTAAQTSSQVYLTTPSRQHC
jgi:hypothetical protein